MESHPKSSRFLLTSLCSHLGRAAFLPEPETTARNVTTSSWALIPQFLFDVWMSILAWRFRFLRRFPKQQNSAGEKKIKKLKNKEVATLVRSSKIVEENKRGWNCSEITLCHLSFPIAFVTLWHTWDLQHRFPPLLHLSWCLLVIFPLMPCRQHCQVLLFSGGDHWLSCTTSVRAAKR